MTLSRKEGNLIKKYRGLGYTQQEVADKIGISRKTVQYQLREFKLQAEQGDNNMGFDGVTYEIDLIENKLKVFLNNNDIKTMKEVNINVSVGLDKNENIIYFELNNMFKLMYDKLESHMKEILLRQFN